MEDWVPTGAFPRNLVPDRESITALVALAEGGGALASVGKVDELYAVPYIEVELSDCVEVEAKVLENVAFAADDGDTGGYAVDGSFLLRGKMAAPALFLRPGRARSDWWDCTEGKAWERPGPTGDVGEDADEARPGSRLALDGVLRDGSRVGGPPKRPKARGVGLSWDRAARTAVCCPLGC